MIHPYGRLPRTSVHGRVNTSGKRMGSPRIHVTATSIEAPISAPISAAVAARHQPRGENKATAPTITSETMKNNVASAQSPGDCSRSSSECLLTMRRAPCRRFVGAALNAPRSRHSNVSPSCHDNRLESSTPGSTGRSATRLNDVTLSVQPPHCIDSVDTDTPSGGGHNRRRVASKRADAPGRAHACARKRDRSVAREPPSERPQQRRYPHKATSYFGLRSPRSERFRNDTPANPRNACATRAPETLTCQGFQAIASLIIRTVALARDDASALSFLA